MSTKNLQPISISTGTILRFVLVILVILLLWALRDFVLVVLTSIVVASFVEAGVPWFTKRKIGRVFAVPIIYIVSLTLLAGIFYIFVPLLITEIYNFSIFLSVYIPDVSVLQYFSNEAFSGAKDIVDNLSGRGNLSFSTLLDTSNAFIRNLSGGFVQALSGAFGSIFNFIVIIVISFYLSIEERGIEKFLRIILPIKYEDYAVDLWRRSRRKIGLWFKGQVLIGILVAVLIYLALSLIGIPYALLLAIIAGLLEFIPYGIIIALVPAISFSFVSGGVSMALIVGGVYIIVHQFEVYLFQPLIINKVVGLSPLVVILAVLVGFELGGFWGILLSVPLAVFLMELVSDIEKKRAKELNIHG